MKPAPPRAPWIPAFAGMTAGVERECHLIDLLCKIVRRFLLSFEAGRGAKQLLFPGGAPLPKLLDGPPLIDFRPGPLPGRVDPAASSADGRGGGCS